MSLRAERVASVIKRALAGPVAELANTKNYGLATVTSVKMSPDLQISKIYISLYGKQSPAAFIKLLESKSSELKSVIAKKVRLRRTPELRFFIDDTLDQMEHIQDLLDSVKKDNNENNQERV